MIIPGYTLHGQIHQGRKCTIYRGERDNDHLAVVLKVLGGEFPSKEDRSRFQRQHELVASLSAAGNPSLVKIYDIENLGHSLVAVMEDFGGSSLDSLLSGGAVQVSDFIGIAIAAVQGLSELHRQNLTHRNVNPSNILWNAGTRELRFVGLSLASSLVSENPDMASRGEPGDDPLYISPEQTGRMNRSVDYRTDIYSLGITFYQLLTGQPPFQSDDVMEILHAHMARIAPAPSELNPQVPAAIGSIVRKMISKNAEDRYQTAEGLLADLRECERQLRETGTVGEISIGDSDRPSRFQIPEKLYGRSDEILRLGELFDRVANGEAAIVMCFGEAGSGKSSLVQELYKHVIAKRGYFIQGKYEEFRRNVPYGAIGQAFSSLIRQFLTESEENLVVWRKVIGAGLGNNVQVVADLIPEIELLVGRSAPSQTLGMIETRNRFSYVFQNFLNAITSQRKPLVIFMDDLQWADDSSLQLLKILASNFGSHHMMFVGAYRSGEVGPSHPVLSTIAEIEQEHIPVERVEVRPLQTKHITELVSDTLRCSFNASEELSRVIEQKTQGNAFFVHQFFKSLYDDGFVRVTPEKMVWEWDIGEIRNQEVTENVATLMSRRIRKFPAHTQLVLCNAACIGKNFDLVTVARICGLDLFSTVSSLMPVLDKGLITPMDDRYQLVGSTDTDSFDLPSWFSFTHSRVQQAAYDLIGDEHRLATHLSIGRLLLATTPEDLRDLRLFEIVSHLNTATKGILDQDERRRLAALNLRAGRKAKESTAYTAALIYFSIGKELLPPSAWETDYNLAFSLFLEQSQCEYIMGDLERATAGFDLVLSKAHSEIERAEVLNLMVVIGISVGKLDEAIRYGKEGLALLGLHLPSTERMTRFRMLVEYGAVFAMLLGRKIDSLTKDKTTTDPRELLIIELCVNIGTAAVVYGSGRLYGLVVMHMMRRSLIHGTSNRSSTIYLGYSLLVAYAAADYKRSQQFGLFGLALADKYHDIAADAKNFVVWSWINHWTSHLKDNLSLLRTAYQKALDSGDHFFATYAAVNHVIVEVYLGRDLEATSASIREFLNFVRRIQNQYGILTLTLFQQYIANRQGKTKSPQSLDNETFSEAAWSEPARDAQYHLVLPRYLLCKQEIFYAQGNYSEALRVTLEAMPLMRVQLKSQFGYPLMFMYHCLILVMLLPSMGKSESKQALVTITRNLKKLRSWAFSSPENYSFMYSLANAEYARIRKRDNDAIKFYELAISSANSSGFTQYAALANELAAKYYDTRQHRRIALAYAAEAHYLYGLWGAALKVADIETKYPAIVRTDQSPEDLPAAPAEVRFAGLDLASILKASQAIGSELQYRPLLSNLLRIVLENSGAARGVLVLGREGEWFVEAQREIGRNPQRPRQARPLAAARDFAQSLVIYVLRTAEIVVVDDPADGILAQDAYALGRRPKSLMCMPIVNQGKLLGALYLENSLVSGVFNADRIDVLRLLSGQIAISIENAQLFESLRLSLDTQTKLIDKLVRGERLATIGTISAEVAHEINNPNHLVLINASALQARLDWLSSALKETLTEKQKANLVSRDGSGIDEIIASLPGTLSDISSAAQRIAHIVSNLKDHAKADPASWTFVDLCDLVHETVRFNKHVVDAATDFLLVKVPQKPVLAHVSQMKISQVLTNLIHNAAHALTSRRQSISITLTVHEAPDNSRAEITVSDEGSGITAEDLPKVGEAFFSTRRNQGGSGLGLMIVKRIVSEHRGTFQIKSTKGSGTSAIVVLPLKASFRLE